MSDISIYHDARQRPELFVWNGPIEDSVLSQWLRTRELEPPTDLVTFWLETGGGEIFEGETLLGPFGDSNLGDDVDGMNSFHQRSGLDPKYLVFHHGGSLVSAVSQDSGAIEVFDRTSYESLRTYHSFSEWYRAEMHDVYKGAYGLG